MATTKEVRALREAGLLTASDVAKALGIGATTLRRLEGKLFEPVPRRGKRQIRVFTPEQVGVLRKELREKSRLGPKPKLVGLEELAGRAGCAAQTIQKRLGTELPPGRKLTAGPRGSWGFTPEEAKQIVAWARKHFRRRDSTSSATRRKRAR